MTGKKGLKAGCLCTESFSRKKCIALEDFLKLFDFKEEEVRIPDEADKAESPEQLTAKQVAAAALETIAVANPSKVMASREEISTDTSLNHAEIRGIAFHPRALAV